MCELGIQPILATSFEFRYRGPHAYTSHVFRFYLLSGELVQAREQTQVTTA